ncbi:MAG: phenylalanine--tRNA ligase subunit beta [Caldilineaceae bacterium]|nr:phenylalanine--tRNA ligase subunit beta [Caldilineaceae bacterium]
MLVPVSWLKEYVEINLPTAALAERLTLAGLEVAAVQSIGDWWNPETVVVGQVVAALPHPNADRLVLVDVDFGAAEPQRVVTGAPNLFAFRGAEALPTLKVAFARTGALLVDAYSEERPRPKKELKPAKIRGVQSTGMVCSERELGLSEEHEGILILPEDAPVGAPLRDYLGDEVLEIEITPDMARCLSIIGIAREVAALTGGRLHLPADTVEATGAIPAGDSVAVHIDDPQLCFRYTGMMIHQVQVGPSPQWMQDRLRKAGMRPINNVVDITNYVMLEWGQPLHAFDYDVLKARARRVGDSKPTIIVRRAQPGERFTTLDDVARTLDDSMLMIADSAGSIALAGVMGGLESEVSDQTKTILLESATFEGINNRRTGQALRLFSEASYRFARGIPPTLNPIAARRAAELMRQYGGGVVAPGVVDAYPTRQPVRRVYITAGDVQRLLGMPVTLDEIAQALRRLDFEVNQVDEIAPDAGDDATFGLYRKAGEPLLECTAPWHRLDVAIPADLTEEVARMIGYEHVGMTLLVETLPTQRRNEAFETEERLRDILVNLGLQENINIPLTTPEQHAKLQRADGQDGVAAPYVTLANPLAPERRVMRRSLLVSALESTARNLRFTNRLATYEVGRIYLPEAGNGLLPHEESRLSIVLTGPRRPATFYPDRDGAEEMDFFDLKGVVETMLARLGVGPTQVEYQAKPNTGTFGPRCAAVVVGSEAIGLMGEIHPQVRAAFGLPAVRVNVAELKLQPLLKPHWRLEPMQPISNYPPVVEDLAFEVDEAVTAAQLQAAIRGAGGPTLVDLTLFDIYRGDPLPAGHKSMAYQLTYQRTDRSLSDAEVTQLRQQIIQAAAAATGARLRG